MSYWGARTGYDYTAQRVAFLTAAHRLERQAAMKAQLTSLGLSPRGLAPELQQSLALAPRGLTPSGGAREMPQMELQPLPPRAKWPGGPGVVMSAPLTTRAPVHLAPLEHKFPSISTSSQVAFGRPDREFLERFRVEREHGRIRDQGTEFREQVFGMWNVAQRKVPAVFRT